MSLRGRVDIGRTLETGTVLGVLVVVLAVTGLLLSPTVASTLGATFLLIQDGYGNPLYVAHLAASALLITFTIWHLLPFRHSFGVPKPARRQGFAISHALHLFVLAQIVTGLVLWFHLYSILPKATSVAAHLTVTFVMFIPFVPHAWRGWGIARDRRAARAAALAAAQQQGRGDAARENHANASRRAFLRFTAYGVAGLALAWAWGRTAADQVMGWRINSVGRTPEITKTSWRLRVTGHVGKPIELTFADILAMPQHTRTMTHHCVEGWTYTDTFTGVKLSDIIARADGVKPEGTMMILKSPEISTQRFGRGLQYTTNFPYRNDILGDIYLVHKAGGKDIPAEHGFPVRIITERKWGYKACKWLTEIELSDDAGYRGYWERFGYHAVGDYPGPIFA